MEQTTNYNLNLPEDTDTVDINVLNENFETIDEQLKLMEDSMTNNDTLDGIQSTVDNNNELLTNTYNIVNSSTYGNSAIKSSIDTIDTNIQSIENKVDNLNDLEINYSYASRENESTTTYLKVDYFRADRNANSHFTGNTGYVSKIRLKIKSGYSGSSVFVTVYEVEKKDSLSEDIIKEKIYDEQEFEIIQTEEYGASIDIPINRTYSTAHYFLIGSTTQAFVPSVSAISTEDPITIELSNIPEVSNTGMVSTGSSYSLFQTIYGGSESLGQILQNTARASEVEDITNITTNTYNIVNSSTYGNSSIKSAIDTIDDNVDTINTNVSSNKSTLSTINTNVSTINTNVSTIKTNTTNTYSIVNNSTYGNSAIKSAIDGIACGYDYVSYMMDCSHKGKLFAVKISSTSTLYGLDLTLNITTPNYTRYTNGKGWLLDFEAHYLSSSKVFYKYSTISEGQFLPCVYIATDSASSDYLSTIANLITNNVYTYGPTPFYTFSANTEKSIVITTDASSSGSNYYIAFILDDPSDIDNVSISIGNINNTLSPTVKLYKIRSIYKSTGSTGYSWTYSTLKTIS